jgi:arginyl-tRNA synthetase
MRSRRSRRPRARLKWISGQVVHEVKLGSLADGDNPSILVCHLLDIAGICNSYYASAPVLERGNARLMITRAAQLVLPNGLKFCHVECSSKI